MQKLQPKLRFPEYKSEWVKTHLGSLFSITAGGDIKSEYVSQEKDEIFKYPIYANAEKNKGLYGYSSIYKIDGGVITIAGRGNIGIAHARKEKFYPIVRLLVLKPKSSLSIDFFEFAINNFNIVVESTGVPQLTAPQISNYLISFPDLPEQTKIASFLSTVDEKIAGLKKQLTLLERYKKGVMQKIFAQELRFQDENGNDFSDWEEKKLGEVMEERNTQQPKSIEFPLMSFVANNGITEKGERYDREFLVNDELNKKYKRTEFGDFIYSSNNLETGSIGINKFGCASISPVYSIFKMKNGYHFIFIGEFLRRKKFINNMIKYRQGVVYGQWRIHEKEFLQIADYFPHIDEQQKIASFLSSIDEKIEKSKGQINAMESWKKGLLQQMFV